MTAFKSDFLNVLHDRGFVHQSTDTAGLDALMSQQLTPAYIGFDATADSLHVGSLIPIMMLRHLQEAGHKPIVLMGGGTTKIGDPSGKDTARQLLTPTDIHQNFTGISKVFSQFLTFGDGPTDATMVNNADWLDSLNYLDFLRDYGRHFSINRMLSFDSVKLRLDREQPLSFLEFNYMILQAYDFTVLEKEHGCRLQLGGSDQWGNIINGIELGRRLGRPQLYGLTAPLLTTSSGAKMGKSASGAIWLNAERLSPYEYWQFWRNTEDGDVALFLKLFTLLPLEEATRLGRLQGSELNEAKKRLADEATILAHGRDVIAQIHQTTQSLYGPSSHGTHVDALEEITLRQADFPQEGLPLISLLQRAGLTPSNGEGRRLIRSKAVRIDGTLIEDEMHRLIPLSFAQKNPLILSAGKKKHVAVKMA